VALGVGGVKKKPLFGGYHRWLKKLPGSADKILEGRTVDAMTSEMPVSEQAAPMAQGPILDHEVSLSRVGGDAELLKELAQLFLEEYPRLLAELHLAYEQRDAKRVERMAHGLKGSVATFGAKRAVDAAAQIEQYGRGGKLEPVAEVMHTLDLVLLALHSELAEL
jgi:HPt (histidine-containing phosphotransfer) domain-containing protein